MRAAAKAPALSMLTAVTTGLSGLASLTVTAMERHALNEEVQARGCALLKTLAWGRRTPRAVQVRLV